MEDFVHVHKVVSKKFADRKDATGKTWGEIIMLGILSAEKSQVKKAEEKAVRDSEV